MFYHIFLGIFRPSLSADNPEEFELPNVRIVQCLQFLIVTLAFLKMVSMYSRWDISQLILLNLRMTLQRAFWPCLIWLTYFLIYSWTNSTKIILLWAFFHRNRLTKGSPDIKKKTVKKR